MVMLNVIFAYSPVTERNKVLQLAMFSPVKNEKPYFISK